MSESRGDTAAIVMIMGQTGTGKSTFINLVSGSQFAVSDGLRSCTADVHLTPSFDVGGRLVRLVDTPGLNDTIVPDAEISTRIASFLVALYELGHQLTGVVYVHRISDSRMSGSSLDSYNLFKNLCGKRAMGNTAIITNMWSKVSSEMGEKRERELRSEDLFFKTAIDDGAAFLRHDGSFESARGIIKGLLEKKPVALRIQNHVADERADFTETEAYRQLNQMKEIAKRRDQILKELMELDQLDKSDGLSEDTRQEIGKLKGDAQKRLDDMEEDRKFLSATFAEGKKAASQAVREQLLREAKTGNAKLRLVENGVDTTANRATETRSSGDHLMTSAVDHIQVEGRLGHKQEAHAKRVGHGEDRRVGNHERPPQTQPKATSKSGKTRERISNLSPSEKDKSDGRQRSGETLSGFLDVKVPRSSRLQQSFSAPPLGTHKEPPVESVSGG